jgi:predicted transcriptional regulator
MAKPKEQALTVRLGEELDNFLEKYAARRGQSKSGILVQLAFELYERERERELDQQWKQAQIVESRLKSKALSSADGSRQQIAAVKSPALNAKNGE